MTSPNETPRGTGRSSSPPENATGTGSPTDGLAEDVRRMASDVVDKTRSAAASMADRVQSEAGDLAEKAKQRAMDAVDEGRDMGANRLEGVAHAAHAAADALEEKVPEFAAYAHRAARSIEDFSRSVRSRSVPDMMYSANDFARRRPAAVFGATLLAGFAVARFLSSSSRDDDGRNRGDEPGGRSMGPGRSGYGCGGESGARMRHGGMGAGPGAGRGTSPMGGAAGTGSSGYAGMESRGEQNSGRNTTGEGIGRRGFSQGAGGRSSGDPARPGMARGVGEGPPIPPMTPGGMTPGDMTPGGLGEGGFARGTPGGEGSVPSVAPSSSPGSTLGTPGAGGTAGRGLGGGRRGPGAEATDKGRE